MVDRVPGFKCCWRVCVPASSAATPLLPQAMLSERHDKHKDDLLLDATLQTCVFWLLILSHC
jgi:hypothetical protein